MFLVDDILLFPFRGMMFVLNGIYNNAQEQFSNEAESIRTSLSELYMRLETAEISEEDFDSQERALLDRLDEVESRNGEDEGAVWHRRPACDSVLLTGETPVPQQTEGEANETTA